MSLHNGSISDYIKSNREADAFKNVILQIDKSLTWRSVSQLLNYENIFL